jgi:hypothetical protein
MLKTDRREISYIYLYAIFAGLINLILPLGVQAILNLLQAAKPLFVQLNHFMYNFFPKPLPFQL